MIHTHAIRSLEEMLAKAAYLPMCAPSANAFYVAAAKS